jgi:AbiV family abortive infection protein
MTEIVPDELKKFKTSCFAHVTDLIESAKLLLNGEKYNLVFHISALALEEMGKLKLATVEMMRKHRGIDEPGPLSKWIEDHEGKLFWALWTPTFSKEQITRKKVEEFKKLAKNIHQKRLNSLYLSVEKPDELPSEVVSKDDAKMLFDLAESILKAEKDSELRNPSEDEVKVLLWFADVSRDKNWSPYIFSGESLDKLQELGSERNWIFWLKAKYEEWKEQSKNLLMNELNRPRPEGEGVHKPKWKLTLKFVSLTHYISKKSKAFDWWNAGIIHDKLYPTNDRNAVKVELTLPAGIPIVGAPDAGMFAFQRLLVAFNISTFGFFWWSKLQVKKSRFDNVLDLSAHASIETKEDVYEFLGPQTELTEKDTYNIGLCFSHLSRLGNSDAWAPFNEYLIGLGFIAKTDIFLGFAGAAFQSFYSSLKGGMVIFGDWDGKSDYSIVFKEYFSDLFPEMSDEQKSHYFALGLAFEAPTPKSENPSLENAWAMKIVCDGYFLRNIREQIERDITKERETSKEQVTEENKC